MALLLMSMHKTTKPMVNKIKENYLKKELYELIKTNDRIFDFIQEGSLDGLWYWDLENPENEWMNTKFWTVLGYDPDKMPHKSSAWKHIINQDDLKVATENLSRHCEDLNQPYDQVVRYTHKDGSTVWIRCRGLAIRDNEGKSIRMLGAHQDISDLKKKEQEINRVKEEAEESEARYRKLFENMNTGFVLFEVVQNEQDIPVDLIILAANDQFEKTTSLNLSNAVGLQLTKVLPGIEKDEADWIGTYSKVALSGESICFEQSSELLGYYYSISAFQAGPKQCAVTFSDITESKRAEKKIIESEYRFRKLYEDSANGMVMIGKDFKFLMANQSFCEWVGYREEELQQLTFVDITHPDDREKDIPHIKKLIAGEIKAYSTEKRFLGKDGQTFWGQVTVSPFYNSNGQFLYNIAMIVDITERKRLQKELETLNTELEMKVRQRTAQLESSNKELEAFSYSVSHDLRAPLRHINGYVELLNESYRDELSTKARHYLDTVSRSSEKMGILIDALLQYSRSGRREITKKELDMNLMVKKIIDQLKENIENRKIIWEIQEMPTVLGDGTLIGQIWANLIENAIKYTCNKKTAKISLGYTEGEKEFVFWVRDNGAGFDMKYAHKLFGVFQRLHSQGEFEGIGIGLANVQRIVHKHMGRVWAEAKSGKGATFYFTLPK